jgi:hypothetical protein
MDQPPNARTVPPVEPGSVHQSPPDTRWPKVIGIICIIFGVLGALGGICGIFGSTISPLTQAGQPEEVRVALDKWSGISVALAIVGMAVAILLLIGGIKLVNRQPKAVSLLRTWAVIKIIVGVISGIVQVYIQRQTMAGIAGQTGPNAPGPEFDGMMVGMMYVIGILSILWLLALPVFLLIWFNRPKIKSEVATWSNDSYEPPFEQPQA